MITVKLLFKERVDHMSHTVYVWQRWSRVSRSLQIIVWPRAFRTIIEISVPTLLPALNESGSNSEACPSALLRNHRNYKDLSGKWNDCFCRLRIWKDKNRLTSLQLCFASFLCGYPRPHIFLKPFNIRGSIQKELSCQKNKTEKAD